MGYRLHWVTDPHLNFLFPQNGPQLFAEDLALEEPDGLVVSGDISEAFPLAGHLKQLADGLKKPVYFVLGNHDYYGGSFKGVHQQVGKIPGWLTKTVVPITEEVGLTGNEGWYDASFGNPYGLEMSDWQVIQEFKYLVKDEIIRKSRNISHKAARAAKKTLDAALELYPCVVFATHFPPFAEACWHEGKLSEPRWMPWFTSKFMGETLMEVAQKHPTKKILVLCGHTHGSGVYKPLPNLTVLTGEANYGHPDLAGVLEIEGQDISVTMKLNRKWASVPLWG